MYNRMPSNREGQLFVPKHHQESLLDSLNNSNSNSSSSSFDIHKNIKMPKMKKTFLNNSMIIEYDQEANKH